MGKLVKGRLELDRKDKDILWLLLSDSKTPLKDIAKKTGLTIDSVFRRIRFMDKNKIIKRYTVSLDLGRLKFNIVSQVNIKLKNISEEKFKEFIAFLVENKRARTVASTMGDYDLQVSFIGHDREEYEKTTSSIRYKFRDIIEDWSSISVLNTYKFNFVKEG